MLGDRLMDLLNGTLASVLLKKVKHGLVSMRFGCQRALCFCRGLPRRSKVTVALIILVLFGSSCVAAYFLSERSGPSYFVHGNGPGYHNNGSSIKKLQLVTEKVNSGLSDLQAKLANIEVKLSGKHSVVNVDKVRRELHSLGEVVSKIERLNQSQYSSLNTHINDLTVMIAKYQKLTAKKLNEIESVKKGIKCLSSSDLPFRIESVDIVNGHNVVAVMYDKMISPLERGFALAGWKLKSSNYEQQEVVFVNKSGMCARVNLNGDF
jgi:hypothetical protein